MAPPRKPEILSALERGAAFFAERRTKAAVVARAILGIPDPRDAELAEQLVQERRRRTRLDGSVDGSLMATAWGAWDLLQLGCPADHVGVTRMVGYLLTRQDKAGRFGEGCSERRHELGHCHHFLSGFFSPGSIDRAIAPLALPTGTVVTGEFDARFAVSCFALRVALRARQEGRVTIQRHVEGLFGLAARWERQGLPALELAFVAAGALALAPPEHRPTLERLVNQLVLRQTPDGRWPGIPLSHAVDALVKVRMPSSLRALERSVPALLAAQQENGAFDDAGDEEVSVIVLRALRMLTAGTVSRPRRQAPRVNKPAQLS